VATPRFHRAQIGPLSLYAAVFLSGVSGCTNEIEGDTGQERVGQAIQPIIRGITSGTEHDSVVVLANFVGGERRNLCTATLVAPNLIITARHCVSDTDKSTVCSKAGAPITGGMVVADRPATNLVVFVGKNSTSPDTTVEKNASARGKKVITPASKTVCNYDLAFLVLDKKLDAPVSPIRLGPPKMSEHISAVGWGVDETGNLVKKREVRNDLPLVGLGPGLYPDNDTWGYGPSEFMIGESVCAGDSGGPSFAKSGALVGIAARAGNGQARDPYNYASTCVGSTAHAVYTHLAAHKSTVERAFKEAGEPIWLEGQPDPRATTGAPSADVETTPGVPIQGEKGGAATSPETSSGPATADAAEGGAGGCSLTSEPVKGSVENAAGVIALVALLAGLRRRFSRSKNARAPHRERMHSFS
jgi:hypothetical protein